MSRLKQKVAVITGAASGIGKAIAELMVAEKASVVITDVNAAKGEAEAERLGCDFRQQNVGDPDHWHSLINDIRQTYGALHILVNNAGIEGRPVSSPETATLDDWRRVQQINVESVFLGCQTAIPLLRDSGGGAIINMSSSGSMEPTPGNMAYGASKAAVRHMTCSLALYCAETGSNIRCNSIHPGVVQTAMMERLTLARAQQSDRPYQQLLDQYLMAIPQGEFQQPADIAEAAVFLASDAARHITGIQLAVDGGMMMRP